MRRRLCARLVFGAGEQREVRLLGKEHQELKGTQRERGQVMRDNSIGQVITGDFGAWHFEEVNAAKLAVSWWREGFGYNKISGRVERKHQQTIWFWAKEISASFSDFGKDKFSLHISELKTNLFIGRKLTCFLLLINKSWDDLLPLDSKCSLWLLYGAISTARDRTHLTRMKKIWKTNFFDDLKQIGKLDALHYWRM